MATTTTRGAAVWLVALGVACGRIGYDAVKDGAGPGSGSDDGGVPVSPIGCADGTREAFDDVDHFPSIAGCQAGWSGAPSLRAPKSGTPCGNDPTSAECVAPADACAPGWSICGDDGDPTVISGRATANECDTTGPASGIFAAAISHCSERTSSTCHYDAPYGCLVGPQCAEPMCCGQGCTTGQACPDGIYPGRTKITAGGPSDGCAAFPIDAVTRLTGVLCCRDVPPMQSGCADGQREAFANEGEYPTIAGCAATWTSAKSMRAPATGVACGDDLGTPCGAPADACAQGWKLCGLSGEPDDITSRISAAQCNEQAPDGGQFVAALSHCSDATPCAYTTPYACLAGGTECAESLCCGAGCTTFQSCTDGIFPAATHVNMGGASEGCGSLSPGSVTGVMCCL